MCSVNGCDSYKYHKYNHQKENSVQFHRFPKDPVTSSKWEEFCKRDNKIINNGARICSKHFLERDYKKNALFEAYNLQIARCLLPFAVPTQNCPDDM